ncbi:MAG: flippase-like domain-containing protein [Ilumatobacteraceae bacterium]|nr:flippase-like domain-containing protein [Ilumatobacteraceae bacterium]
MSNSNRRPLLAKLASIAGVLIGLAGVAFVVRTLLTKRDEVGDAFSQLNGVTLIASLLLGLCAMTLIGFLWTRMLVTRGHHAPPRSAMSWYFAGQLGKYVPGGIWPIVGRAELAVRGGVPRPDAYAATGLSMVTTYLAAALTICLGSLLSWTYPLVGILGFAAFALGFLAFSNATLRTKVLTVLNRVSPRASALTEPRRLLILTVTHLPAWILMSLSTSVTASAFGADIGIMHMLFITSASWLAGFVVVGVPGGIGVRESVFTALAGTALTPGVAVSLALASRVVFIAVDLLGALVAHLIARTAPSTKA